MCHHLDSLFTHDRKLHLAISSAGLLTIGTACASLYGQATTLGLYLFSGLFGNSLKLGLDFLGRKITSRLGVQTMREWVFTRFGDLGVGPSLSSAGSLGAVLGLMGAVWSVAVTKVPRTVQAQAMQVQMLLLLVGGMVAGVALPLELLFPRFGKACLIGGFFGGVLGSAVLPRSNKQSPPSSPFVDPPGMPPTSPPAVPFVEEPLASSTAAASSGARESEPAPAIFGAAGL